MFGLSDRGEHSLKNPNATRQGVRPCACAPATSSSKRAAVCVFSVIQKPSVETTGSSREEEAEPLRSRSGIAHPPSGRVGVGLGVALVLGIPVHDLVCRAADSGEEVQVGPQGRYSGLEVRNSACSGRDDPPLVSLTSR